MAAHGRSSGEGSETARRRRLLVEMARRRARPGGGTSPLLLRERTARAAWPDLSRILSGLPWAVVGAGATRAYMPERATGDLDVLVPSDHLARAEARLRGAGFRKVGGLAVGGGSWRAPSGEAVDVIALDEAWVREALRRPGRDRQGLPVLSLPYLVLTKVRAGRLQDLADASRMLGLAAEELREATRQAFRRHMPEATEDLDSLITLGEREVGGEGQA